MPQDADEILRELKETLDDNNVPGFIDAVNLAVAMDVSLEQPYGREAGYKTILHLALEEDDGEPYVEELLRSGALANHYNNRTGNAPVHVGAAEALPDIFRLLFKYPGNKAEVNTLNKDGLTALHILLGQLIDLAALENKPVEARGSDPPADEDIEESMLNVFDCILVVLEQRDLRTDFDAALSANAEKTENIKSKVTMKKLTTMTPLQIICSFQTWNAKPISDILHDKLEEVVEALLKRGINPNAVAAKGVPGSVPGSTPAVFLAATRGYWKVVQLFKQNSKTNFLIENKFQQTILHMVLKSGYYNKIAIHGEECGDVNIKTLEVLFDDENMVVQSHMKGIVNRLDHYGNSAAHYARPYPDQSVAKLLFKHGARIEINEQSAVNVHPRTLEEHFYENCIQTKGEDIDDEEFEIRIYYTLFEKPLENSDKNLNVAGAKKTAWALMEQGQLDGKKKGKKPVIEGGQGTGKVDTKRLEYFSDVDSLHYLLKHPVLNSFLELELNSLKIRYLLDFIFYLAFVVVLFLFLSTRYGLSHNISLDSLVIYENTEHDWNLSVPLIILMTLLVLIILREFYQMFRYGKRYWYIGENYLEWTIICLVIVNIMPNKWINEISADDFQRHVAALTLLLAFMQLYLVLVRIVPNTPIPVYINMFSTVLKTYTFILLSYLAFIISFAYSFYLILGQPQNDVSCTEDAGNCDFFGNLFLSSLKTLVMFVGEMDYTDMQFSHWLGQVIFLFFIFLMIIVLMNILNGLAVSDISKIREEVDTYHLISTVETLSHTSFVSLLAEEIVIQPNIKTENQTFLGISVPGTKVYRVRGGKIGDDATKKNFFLSEATVKAAKELVYHHQQKNDSMGKVTLETLGDKLMEVRREQGSVKQKLAVLEESIRDLLEIMASRHAPVERI